jgi:hypothetical protein
MFTRSRVMMVGPMLNRTPGFSIVHVDENMDQGYRARFLYATTRNSVFLHFSKQISQKRAPGLSAAGASNVAEGHAATATTPGDNRTFGRPLMISIPVNTMVKMLTTLEGGDEPVEFNTRNASGAFQRLPGNNHSFAMRGTSSVNTDAELPTEFNFVIDAGHAMILHRFLNLALSEAMGFNPQEHLERLPSGGNASNYGNQGNNQGRNQQQGGYNNQGRNQQQDGYSRGQGQSRGRGQNSPNRNRGNNTSGNNNNNNNNNNQRQQQQQQQQQQSSQ